MNKSQSGFTLVELVVVILVLGILSATALPRFMNVNEQAHHAVVAGVGGSFSTAVTLTKAQWIANGSSAAESAVVNFGEGNVSVNATGWPINISGGAADAGTACVNVWDNIMQSPPSVDTATGRVWLGWHPANLNLVSTIYLERPRLGPFFVSPGRSAFGRVQSLATLKFRLGL